MAAVSHFEDNSSFTYVCPLTRTGKRSAHSTCAKKFADDHGFQLVESSDDGNCFFYTLTEFGKRSGYEPLRLHPKKHDNAMALRQQLVDYIESHFEEYAHYLVHNNNNNGNNSNNNNDSNDIYGQIQKLRRNGAWASNAGDLVPMVAPHVFGIHINLYNIEVGDDSDLIRLMPIRSHLPTTVFVSIMRVRQGHFQLLWPRSGIYTSIQDSIKSISVNKRDSINKRNNHSIHPNQNTTLKDIVHAAQLSVEAAKIAVDTVMKTASASDSSLSSLSKNEQKLNQIIQDLNQLSMSSTRRSTRSTRSSTRSLPTYGNRLPSPSKQSTTRRRSKRGSPSPSSTSSASYLNNNNELRKALELSKYNK